MFQEQIGFPGRRVSIRLGLLIGKALLPAFDFAFQNCKAKGVGTEMVSVPPGSKRLASALTVPSRS